MYLSNPYYRPPLKNLETKAPPTFLASEPEYSPRSTNPLAWLNLSQREKASVFVIVSTRAITMHHGLATLDPNVF